MNIIVCVKEVYDVSDPFVINWRTGKVDYRSLVKVSNPADMTALALARASFPAPAHSITAICVGPEGSDALLRECLSQGADDALRLWSDETDLAADRALIARVLAGQISQMGADLVFCGSGSPEGGPGFVGPALAELLGAVQVPQAVEVGEDPEGGDCVIVKRKLARGAREVDRCPLPAVLTVDDGDAEVPYVGLPDLIRARRAEIRTVVPRQGGVQATADGELVGTVAPRPRTKRVYPDTSGFSRHELMSSLIGVGGPTGGSVAEGTPAQVAEKVVEYLEDNGLASWQAQEGL